MKRETTSVEFYSASEKHSNEMKIYGNAVRFSYKIKTF